MEIQNQNRINKLEYLIELVRKNIIIFNGNTDASYERS